MQLSKNAIVTKLEKKYTIIEFEEAKKILNRNDLRTLPKDSLQQTIFRINE